MIGILFIYFIWKYFADLAFEYDKSRWGYGILGVVAYYSGYFLFIIFLGMLSGMEVIGPIDEMNETILSLISIPAAVLCCWGTYKILKNRWSKKSIPENSEVLDQNLEF